MGLGRGRFWIGGGGCLNSCQSFRRSRESEFPPTEESGLQTPPTRDTPIKESGLQTPPTRDTPIKESGLQTPPTRDTPIKESGLQTPPTRDTPIKESGLQTPPTKEITFPEEIHVDGGVFSLHPFLFLLLKQQKPGNLYASQRPFRCMLFNNFNIYCLKNV